MIIAPTDSERVKRGPRRSSNQAPQSPMAAPVAVAVSSRARCVGTRRTIQCTSSVAPTHQAMIHRVVRAVCIVRRETTAVLLELRDPRARAILVLLRGAAAHAARALDDAVADDRHGALAGNHVAALGVGDALDDRAARALGQL